MKKVLAYLLLLSAVVTSFYLQGCKKDENPDPQVQTLEVTASSPVKVTFTGSVVNRGKYAVSDYGFIYGTTSNIDESNGTKVSLGAEVPIGDFSKEVNNITVSSTYYSNVLYARAYLKNEKGTVFGKVISVSLPAITASALSPQSGKSGDLVTITGQFYTATADQISVTFNNIKAKVTEASSSKIVVEVPSGVSATHNSQVSVAITIGGQRVNSNYYFTMLANVKDYSPKSGVVGTMVTFSGDNLPSYYNYSNIKVLFGQTEGTISYNSNGFQIAVPNNVTSDKFAISVVVNGITTVLPGEFSVVAPTITSVSPTSGLPGTQFTISGTNFPTNFSPTLMIGSTTVSYYNMYNNTISAYIPSTMAAGTYDVTLKAGPNTVTAPQKFTVIAPSVSSFSPASGSPGREINITGNFMSGSSYNVYFGSTYTSGTATSSTNLKTTVPGYINPGNVKIAVQFNNQNIYASGDFTIIGPSITGFTPASGVAGSIVTINGAGFGTNSYNVAVKFGSTAATVLSVTDNAIRATVPSGVLGAMKISVTTNGQTIVSNDNYTVTN
jgi:hypothetical protein